MKFYILSPEKRLDQKLNAMKQWHKRFAFLPVRVSENKVLWLCQYERRMVICPSNLVLGGRLLTDVPARFYQYREVGALFMWDAYTNSEEHISYVPHKQKQTRPDAPQPLPPKRIS